MNEEFEANDHVAKDTGQGLSAASSSWSFAGDVYSSFDEHIQQSIPAYSEAHQFIAALSDFFVHPGGVIYELGTSTGVLANRLALRHKDKVSEVIGLDIENAMITEATRRYANVEKLSFIEADLASFRFRKCDFAVSYCTLQFMRKSERRAVLRSLHSALAEGGAFVLFEKTREDSGIAQDLMSQIYVDFKEDRGFNASQIIAKTQSLRSVLEPQSGSENMLMLREAGFSTVALVQKNLCFEGYLAVR